MTVFKISPANLEKCMHQNRAKYAGVCVEGTLLDNFVVVTKRGFAAIYERYVNPNMSEYLVEFEPGAAQGVWKRWYEFEERSGQDEQIAG